MLPLHRLQVSSRIGRNLCGLVLALAIPAGAAQSASPAVSAEMALPMAATPAASWDEVNIRASQRVFAVDIPAPSAPCVAGAMHQHRVLIQPDRATVNIVGAGSQSRTLALRDGLLPDVHYLPDGRHALLATSSGWLLRLDLAQAQLVAEVRVGLMLRGVALSAPHEGLPRLLAAANAAPHTLVIVDEQLKLVKLLRVADKTGRRPSGVAAIRVAQARSSFVATLLDVPELWELSYNPKAPEIALGLVHDFQYREGYFVPGYLNPQRSTLSSPARDFLMAPDGNSALTAHAGSESQPLDAGVKLRVTHLDVRRRVAEVALPGWPALDRSLLWRVGGQDRLAVPDEKLGLVSVIDPDHWALLGQLRTDGPVRVMRNPADSPWLWLDTGTAPNAGLAVLKVNKNTLEVVERLAAGVGEVGAENPPAPVYRCSP